MDMMESAISFCEGISQIAQARGAYNRAFHLAQPRCGGCRHWMKKGDCPRERGVMVGGPTSGDMPCKQFLGDDQHNRFVAAFVAMPRPK